MIFLIFLFLATVFGSPLDQRLNPVRIIGGHDANITDYPYQVAVFISGSQRCGGAIIGNTLILSSASCATLFNGSDVQVRAGSSNCSEGGELINVKKINSHPKYNLSSTGFVYDIAVLELESPLTYNAGIQPIQLPNNSTTLKYGQNGTITGWGLSFNGPDPTEILQVADVPIAAEEDCKFYYNDVLQTGVICADGDHKYSCTTDSGGPLVVDGILQGILSVTYCGFLYPYSIYTEVSLYLDFINPFLKQQ